MRFCRFCMVIGFAMILLYLIFIILEGVLAVGSFIIRDEEKRFRNSYE